MDKSQEPKLIKGVELRETKLVRICNPDKIHNKYEWHDGENIDVFPFIAKGTCLPGGLYFTTIEYLFYFTSIITHLDDHWFVRLTVDDDEDVWQEPNGKWKAHRVMVTSMTRIKDMPEEALYQMVTLYLQNRYKISYRPFDLAKRDDLWCKIISDIPCTLQFVRNQTDKMCRDVVRNNGCFIRFVYDPVQIVSLVGGELRLVRYITDWTCDLVDAFLVSGQYTFKFQFCYDDNIVHSDYPNNLHKLLTLNEQHDSKLQIIVIRTESTACIFTTYITPELADYIYEKVYSKNK